ncbi:hypothetical protein FBZ87_1035 [Nitrospirillum amazonense]|uniref:Uncharacterized protein n=1 Tax=Nitrospirillum amazonense TaxID=28077 RepID=A0A560K1H5_9PROT|nr:hypothetical protein [Nitrospirillum amazonense]TWB77193.1 hypothetical protein FBZ87_1035 [Nitrospirillum amazonense]
MSINSAKPIPGTDAYWMARHEAFAFIRRLERAIVVRNQAPIYVGGDDLIENTGPWERVCALQDEARGTPMVMEILGAQLRLKLLTV